MNSRRPRGAVLIVVLVCFIIVATLFALIARQAWAERRMSDTALWSLEARWVAEAAIDRAAARLKADHRYQGETWSIDAADLPGDGKAKAVIMVAAITGHPDARTVRVVAEYPDAPIYRASYEKKIVVEGLATDVPKTNEAPKAAEISKPEKVPQN